MKLLYITTANPRAQGDFQEVMMLHGLRSILGNGCVDFPKKKVMYRDFSETPQRELHGNGFTLYTIPIDDVSDRSLEGIDAILYGVTDAYGTTDYADINKLCPNVFYLDGHDDERIRKTPCFKRELYRDQPGVFPTGFGIPHYQIRPLNLSRKKKLHQLTTPKHSVFQHPTDLGTRHHYVFRSEKEYFDDMSDSFFGLTSMKGGWDSLRHYEIMASGSLLLFRDYDKKPSTCSPVDIPCISYSSMDELNEIMNTLVDNGKPSSEYVGLLMEQRDWLLKNGTTEARAIALLKKIMYNIK